MSNLNDIFESLIDPNGGGFSAELAQYVLSLKLSTEQNARCQALATKGGEGTLTSDERAELDAYATANAFLMALKSKARRSLLQRSPAA